MYVVQECSTRVPNFAESWDLRMQVKSQVSFICCCLSCTHVRADMKHTSDTCFASLVAVAYRLNEPQYLCKLRVVEQSHVRGVEGTNIAIAPTFAVAHSTVGGIALVYGCCGLLWIPMGGFLARIVTSANRRVAVMKIHASLQTD
jgi:hypothetical protein